MKNGYTPGPWDVSDDNGVTCLITSGEKAIARVWVSNTISDARLIAAAPELLEALKC